jgi:uncharacterized membrane protein
MKSILFLLIFLISFVGVITIYAQNSSYFDLSQDETRATTFVFFYKTIR